MDSIYRPVDGSAGSPSKRFWTRQRAVIAGAAGLLLLLLFSGGHYASKSQVLRSSSLTVAGSSLMQAADCDSARKLRVLHLIDRPTMESTMDRWFMRSQQEFEMATDLVADAPLWGRGFDGYDEKETLVQNIVRKYGKADYFDAVLAYYNGDQDNHLRIDPAPRFLQIAELSRHGVVIMDRPHEMRDRRRVPMYDLANVSLVLAPYAHELLEYRDYGKQALLVQQPHPVEPRLFEHPLNGPKTRDVILAGSLEAPMYPLRHRLSEMIKAGKIPGYIRPHPGYPDILTAEDRERLGIDAAYMEKQLQDFSSDLASSKICFVTASRWQYSIQKYGEAAAAGCLVIGTLPLDRRDAFREFVVEISNNDSDAHIASVIDHWLKDEQGRLAKAKLAQDWFLSKFSGRNFVEDIVSWIKIVQSGRRGLLLPHQWDFLPDPLPLDG